MDHSDVLKQIINNLTTAILPKRFRVLKRSDPVMPQFNCDMIYRLTKFRWKIGNYQNLEINDAFSEEVQRSICTSLMSLYILLSKQCPSFNSDVHSLMKQLGYHNNFSSIKPSMHELKCMCERNLRLFTEGTHEHTIIFEITHYIRILASECTNEYSYENMQYIWYNQFENSCFLFENDILQQNNELGYVLYVFFYYYLFLILEKENLIVDNYEPWNACLVNNWIYLPFEGSVNLVYFNYLINPGKGRSSKSLEASCDKFKENMLSKCDCGFMSSTKHQLNINKKELIFLLDPTLDKNVDKISKDELRKYIKIPLSWLTCFHIASKKDISNETEIKLIKVLHDIEIHSGIKGLCTYGDYSVYKVLSNIDECNFNVRAILYNNIFGNVSTCIKSTIFRDLPLSTIWHLERTHDIVMDHLGNFVKHANCFAVNKNTSISDKEQLFSLLRRKIKNYSFNNNFSDKFRDNALIQMIAWLFLSEIYAYIKTEVIISKYMVDNVEGFNENDGYFPEKVPADLHVVFEDLSLWKNNGDGNSTTICDDVESFYRQQDIFLKEDINVLIQLTRTVIFRFYGDTMVQIQGPQNCTLRQFMTVSLVLVKSQKGTNIFPKIPEFKFYGHSTQRLSVYKYLTDPQQTCDLKQVMFASKLFERQNNAFIKTSRIDLYDKFIIDAYTKILEYLDKKIPILKTGSKTAAEKEEKKLNEKVTPYALLMSVYDVTINLFDKFLGETP